MNPTNNRIRCVDSNPASGIDFLVRVSIPIEDNCFLILFIPNLNCFKPILVKFKPVFSHSNSEKHINVSKMIVRVATVYISYQLFIKIFIKI